MNGFRYIRTIVLNKSMSKIAKDINVSKQAIQSWEIGRKSFPIKRAKQMSELYNVPIEVFYITDIENCENDVINIIRIERLKADIIKYLNTKNMSKIEINKIINSIFE